MNEISKFCNKQIERHTERQMYLDGCIDGMTKAILLLKDNKLSPDGKLTILKSNISKNEILLEMLVNKPTEIDLNLNFHIGVISALETAKGFTEINYEMLDLKDNESLVDDVLEMYLNIQQVEKVNTKKIIKKFKDWVEKCSQYTNSQKS